MAPRTNGNVAAVIPSFPTVAEVLQDPAFTTATWALHPTRSGLLPVAIGRGGPFRLSWEIHGHGPRRLIFIMGLGALKSAWQRQTLCFGHERADEYSVLILDNRGIGNSDVPLMRYSSSEMARDIIEVLDHVGWLEPGSASLTPSTPSPSPPSSATSSSTPSDDSRRLHIFGISLGGMISQELALLIPNQISTLNLLSTAAVIENTTTFWENLVNRAGLIIPKSLEDSVKGSMLNMYPPSFLQMPDTLHLPDPATVEKVGAVNESSFNTRAGATERDASERDAEGGGYAKIPEDGKYMHFTSNYHRLVAQEMHKRLNKGLFTTTGFMLQLVAAGWHHKSREQLSQMADEVGRERITVVHGTADRMIHVVHGEKLVEMIQPGKREIVEGMGHVAPIERCEWFNGFMERVVREGEARDGR